MRICSSCGRAIHPHDAEPRAIVAIYRQGRMRRFSCCGECASELERQMGRAPLEAIPADPPLRLVTR